MNWGVEYAASPVSAREDSHPKTQNETPENGKQENDERAPPRQRRSLGRVRFGPGAGSINPRFAAQARCA